MATKIKTKDERWTIYLLGGKATRLGSLTAPSEAEAIELATAKFGIAPALAFKLAARRA